MTAKDKAMELLEKYYTLQHKTIICSKGYGKECALICVDEILNAVKTIADKKYDYWKEVKEEINKL